MDDNIIDNKMKNLMKETLSNQKLGLIDFSL